MSEFEERHDRDGHLIEEEEPERRETLSERLDRLRADALEKELAAERADQVAALSEQMKRPIKASDLQSKPGGVGPGLIDAFFTDDDRDLN